MPTINATVVAAPAYVLVEANWNDTPTVTYAGVTRRNTVTGEIVTLRPYGAYDGDGDLLLSCGFGLWWDTEPPLNVPLEYCTFASDTATLMTTNPDFEVTLAPWQDLSATVARSNLFAHQGSWSAQLTPVSANGRMINADDTAPFLVGQPITFQAWAMSPQGYNGVLLTAQVQYDDGELVSFNSAPEILDDGLWQFISTEFTPTKPGYITLIQFSYLGTAPVTTLFYVDQIGAYQLRPVTGSACETVTVTSDSVWLKNPIYPCLDIEVGLCSPAMDFDCESDSRVSYVGMGDDERDANTVLSEPANRKYPIPTSRIRRAPRSELRLLAHDCAARDEVVASNDPGTPLLFQAPADYCIDDRYISVATLAEVRLSVDQREDFRLMTLPYAVVQRPEGPADGICGARIEDLCDLYASWQSMSLAALTYRDLLLGFASGDGPFAPVDGRIWGEVETEFASWLAVEAGGTRDWGELRDGL